MEAEIVSLTFFFTAEPKLVKVHFNMDFQKAAYF